MEAPMGIRRHTYILVLHLCWKTLWRLGRCTGRKTECMSLFTVSWLLFVVVWCNLEQQWGILRIYNTQEVFLWSYIIHAFFLYLPNTTGYIDIILLVIIIHCTAVSPSPQLNGKCTCLEKQIKIWRKKYHHCTNTPLHWFCIHLEIIPRPQMFPRILSVPVMIRMNFFQINFWSDKGEGIVDSATCREHTDLSFFML